MGQLRSGRFAIIRTARHQRFHALLGFTHVRLVFHDQHYRPTQYVDCHDVQLLRCNCRKNLICFGGDFILVSNFNQTNSHSRGVIPNGNSLDLNFGSVILMMAPLFHHRSTSCRRRNPCLAGARKSQPSQQR